MTGYLYADIIRHIFELEPSTLVSDSYGLMQCILNVIYVPPFCNFTIPLVKHCALTNGPIYGISYLYAVCLVSMMLSPTL